MDKPIGSLLLVWPMLWSMWFASGGFPDLATLLIFIAGTVLMRSAGCAINDIADRDFDLHVERTHDRVLTSGQISLGEAVAVFVTLCLISLVLVLWLALVHLQSSLVLWLTLPALFLAATYPYTKRFFPLPQAYLGIAYGFGIPMAYAAAMHRVPPEGWLLLVANIFWSLAYDTEYAMVDRNDDIHLGIKTSALTFGRFDVVAVMICYAITLSMVAAIGFMVYDMGLFFAAGLLSAAIIAIRHYFWIRGRERMPCFRAFLHNNYLGMSIFIGVAAEYAWRQWW